MKTKMLLLAVLLTLLPVVHATNDHKTVIDEAEAAKAELYNTISLGLKKLSTQVNEQMNGIKAEIYFQVQDVQTINFYHVKCCNSRVADLIKEYLQAQHFVAHELLIGEKYKINVYFKYVEP